MNVLISGGCKNGKSYYAQRQARDMARQQGKPLYYIATMIPRDEEDRARIRRHLAERDGWGFETLEQPVHLTALLDDPSVDRSGVFLLDSVTAIMENEMFQRIETEGTALKGNAGIEIVFDETAPERVAAEMETFAKATGNTVFVSDGIYGDMGEYSQSTEDYRKALAGADRTLAKACDRVIEITYGMEEIWK